MSWGSGWPPVIAALAVTTMIIANLTAGRQESVKRMLAYSSIAHAGYILVGVVSTVRAGGDGQASVLFYLFAYTFSTVGAFGALILCGSRGKEAVSYEDLAGVGRRHPAAAAFFSLFLLSLAGIPPTAGFFAKLYVIKAAIGADMYWLAVILLLNSVLAAYYYLRVMVYMYMREPAAGAPVATPMKSGYVNAALVLASIIVVVVGLLPGTSLGYALPSGDGRLKISMSGKERGPARGLSSWMRSICSSTAGSSPTQVVSANLDLLSANLGGTAAWWSARFRLDFQRA